MAYHNSYKENSENRHVANIYFIESFLIAHNISEGFSRATLLFEKANKLLKKIAKKPIDQISSLEIDKIVFVANKIKLINQHRLEFRNGIMKYKRIPTDLTVDKFSPAYLKAAVLKLIEREETALENSVFEEAIERHNHNLAVLKWWVS